MTLTRDDLRAALRDQFPDFEPFEDEEEGDHPTLDELADYHAKQLSDREAVRMRDHLGFCPACAELLLDYHDFAGEEGSAADVAAAAAWTRRREWTWKGILRRLRGEPGAGRAAVDIAATAGHGALDVAAAAARVARRVHPAQWVAAGLAAASLVLGLLLWQARAELRSPRPVTFLALAPEGFPVLRGPEPPVERPVAPAAGSRVVALLGLPDPDRFRRYEVRLTPPAGERAERVLQVEPGPDSTLAVELGIEPAPGPYRLVLHGVAPGERQEVARYTVVLGEP